MDVKSILEEAHAAAAKAVEGQEDRGACGFAWVAIPDARSSFVKGCRKLREAARNGTTDYSFYGDNGYPKGWQWWCPGHFRGQSINAMEIGAWAFYKVLQSHGIDCYVGSRLD